MFCLVFVFSCVFRIFEENKVFLENSKLKGQFGRKTASNEIKHKFLGTSATTEGSSAADQGSNTSVLDRTRSEA
jgi:hypothetical protein